MLIRHLAILILCIESTHAFRSHRPPIQHLFATTRRKPSIAEARKPGIDASELRSALSSAGSDVSPKTNKRLIDSYGDENNRIRLKEFDELVRKDKHLSGARLWLTIDPYNSGIRSSRVGFSKFGKAGSQNVMKFLHYGFGVASLSIGTTNMLSMLIEGLNGRVYTMTYEEVMLFAFIHTIASIFSLPRFEYDFKEEEAWKLGLKTSREANMWPSFITNMWYTLSLLSDNVWTSDTALFAFNEAWFINFGIFMSTFLCYGIARGFLEDIETGDTEWRAAKISVFSMTPVLIEPIKVLFFGSSDIAHAQYTSFLSQYPEFGMIQIAGMLGTIYGGNLLCALESSKLHKAVTDDQIQYVNTMIFVVYLPIIVLIAQVALPPGFFSEYMDLIKSVAS